MSAEHFSIHGSRLFLRLYDSYTGPKRLWEFPDGDHGTVMMQPPGTWNQIVDFWHSNQAVSSR
jgi:hypothetical protein